ncbi:ABC-type spermidine/putrescine transport system,permease component I [Pseudomonas knackmussii B13]|uniref:ABC-type spermidine/putrescine transport system,permease component I n=1 Tax=Pseudomonas knackmussii (strain DSM 6978 / CCUG 54928 / LMG 23759 / B13) TaxID=1301098 RepID=A0A024HPN6_PSEKB|nr:ABC transporter permease [Pseudomonas knackmussii]CDF86393.1 ABC-type spermidine/putrescine transport system,permease component I [Pseudomonas knackmussii B13]
MSVTARSPATSRLLLLSPVALTLLALIAIPLGIMGYISLLPRNLYGGVDWHADWQIQSYVQLFFQEDFDGNLELNWVYAQALLRSLLQAGGTTLLCFLVGFPVALWMSSLNERARNLMVLLITIPFWTNLLIRNYAWLIILREHGWIAQAVNALFPQAGGITLLYNDFAVSVGLVYSFLPFMILPIYSTLEKLDWRLVEAAYDLGATRWKALRRVILPLTMPGVIAGALLVFVPSLGAFITPAILGGGKTLMIGNLIQQQFGTARNWPLGGSLSFLLLGIMLLALVLFALYSRKAARSVHMGGAA